MKNPKAFPLGVSGEDEDGHIYMVADGGMTLLDYFAGQCLAGTTGNSNLNSDKVKDIAIACYSMAEAMLEEREKRKETK